MDSVLGFFFFFSPFSFLHVYQKPGNEIPHLELREYIFSLLYKVIQQLSRGLSTLSMDN
jgi:hypothetical protein